MSADAKKRLGILFLGGAKRVAMARMFRRACQSYGFECEIYGYELDRRCPLAAEAEVIEGLRWKDPDLYGSIDEVVAKHGIDIMVPFVDPAVGIAARYAQSRPGVFVPGSDASLSDSMFDKAAAAALFELHELPVPHTYHSGDRIAGLIAKPRFGSASKGIFPVDSEADLASLPEPADSYLIQERIDRRCEITVDCYVSTRDSRICAVSPRERLEVSGGEAVRTVTVDDPDTVALARRTLSALGLKGAVTIQFIRDLDSGRLLIMEINPRLGGGAVASVHAGADIPRLIVGDAVGDDIRPVAARPGVLVTRYLEDVVFYPERS
ncbi:MAG: ATP-grasp domain-containing protein [Muribaculaceae bacterium]|nr:ATP-grasp domain-containing protein [Muribaculaceae bacterium]MDE6135303.1 ATP-grasp domain-containing protein [Muribaculaceae bacterium]